MWCQVTAKIDITIQNNKYYLVENQLNTLNYFIPKDAEWIFSKILFIVNKDFKRKLCVVLFIVKYIVFFFKGFSEKIVSTNF